MTNFFNFENNPVHPVDLSPDGRRLAVCNVPDDRLEIFDLTSGTPVSVGSVTVGLDPVSVRFRTTNELWVANYVSSSVSIVNLGTLQVSATIATSNEPADIVFAGIPTQAWISCDQPALVQVYNVSNFICVSNIAIDGNRPRALAVSPDSRIVYVAIFQSGNGSTIIGQGISPLLSNPRAEPVSLPDTPYGGEDPPPNDGSAFVPALNPGLAGSTPPRTGLIVKKNGFGRWVDDNQGDWTSFISGTNAALTGRPESWNLPDHDLATINTSNFAVSYACGLMNLCMAVNVNPATGQIAVVGTDAQNQIRFQPVLNGVFVRVELALVDPVRLSSQVFDLNPQLNYQTPVVSPAERNLAVGDPRGIVWSADGSTGYIAGMGSGNVIVIDANGHRIGTNAISVGEGPTGMALDSPRNQLYVYNKFDGTLSTINLTSSAITATLPLFDPTPPVVKNGRPFLYDTHLTSGLGQASCASCHVDGRVDGLAWDLGDPTSTIEIIDTNYNFANPLPSTTNNYHPMKGPMVTLTLQDIIGHEPFHWRGDRQGIEQFNITFTNLQAMPQGLDTNEMAEFKSFLATIGFGPNPYRPRNNSLSTNLAMPGLFVLGRGTLSAGAPLPNGNASNGLAIFRDEQSANDCVLCHTLPTGLGADMEFVGSHWAPIAPGSNSAHHIQVVQIPRSDNLPFKIPQLRNLFDKTGMDLFHTNSRSGFGFSHDGSVDSLVRFVQDSFQLTDDQQTADLTAFLLSITGSDLPAGSLTDPDNAPGVASLDEPAAVGWQITLTNPAANTTVNSMLALAGANTNLVDLIAKGSEAGLPRGWQFVRTGGYFQSDRLAETETPSQLAALASAATPLTFTIVPAGSGERLGIDRDADGYFDRDELDAGYDPANPLSTPPFPPPRIGDVFLSMATNAILVSWNAVPGLTCQLQYTTSLLAPSWVTIATNTAGIGLTAASDINPTLNTARFYRIFAP